MSLVKIRKFVLLFLMLDCSAKSNYIYQQPVFSISLDETYSQKIVVPSLFGFSIHKVSENTFYIGAPNAFDTSNNKATGGVFTCKLPSTFNQEVICGQKINLLVESTFPDINALAGASIFASTVPDGVVICTPNLATYDNLESKNLYSPCYLYNMTSKSSSSLFKSSKFNLGISMAVNEDFSCAALTGMIYGGRVYGYILCRDGKTYTLPWEFYRYPKSAALNKESYFYAAEYEHTLGSYVREYLYVKNSFNEWYNDTQYEGFNQKGGYQIVAFIRDNVKHMLASFPARNFGLGRIIYCIEKCTTSYLNGKRKNSYFGQSFSLLDDISGDQLKDLVVSAPLDGKDNLGVLYFFRLDNNLSDESLLYTVELANMKFQISNIYNIFSGYDINADGTNDLLLSSFNTSKLYGILVLPTGSLEIQCLKTTVKISDFFPCVDNAALVCLKLNNNLNFILTKKLPSTVSFKETSYNTLVSINKENRNDWFTLPNLEGFEITNTVKVSTWPDNVILEYQLYLKPTVDKTLSDLLIKISPEIQDIGLMSNSAETAVNIPIMTEAECVHTFQLDCRNLPECITLVKISSIRIIPSSDSILANIEQIITVELIILNEGHFFYDLTMKLNSNFGFVINIINTDRTNIEVDPEIIEMSSNKSEVNLNVLGMITRSTVISIQMSILVGNQIENVTSTLQINEPTSNELLVKSDSKAVDKVVLYSITSYINEATHVIRSSKDSIYYVVTVIATNLSPSAISGAVVSLMISSENVLGNFTTPVLRCNNQVTNNCELTGEDGFCYHYSCSKATLDSNEIVSASLTFKLNAEGIEQALKKGISVSFRGTFLADAKILRTDSSETIATLRIISAPTEKKLPKWVIPVGVIGAILILLIIIGIMYGTGVFKKLAFKKDT